MAFVLRYLEKRLEVRMAKSAPCTIWIELSKMAKSMILNNKNDDILLVFYQITKYFCRNNHHTMTLDRNGN